MIGLIKKDLYNISGGLKIYVLIPVLFAFLSYVNGNMDLLAFGTCFIGLFIVISCCAYDELADFNAYALTLPISRKDLVIAKFEMANICSILVFVIANLLANGLYLLDAARFAEFSPLYFLEYTWIASFTCNIVIALLLSIIFKFGTEKGRIVFLVIFLGTGAVVGVLGSLNIPMPNLSFLAVLDDYFLVIITILGVIAEIVGIMISTKIMNHKEM